MNHLQQFKRDNRFFVASTIVGLISFALFGLLIGTAFAFTLLGEREIKMGSSQPGDATDYTVEFEVSTPGDLGGIVVTFCANTPTIGDSECETPSNFDVTTALANLDMGDVDLTGYQAVTADHSSSGSGGDNTVILHSGAGAQDLGDTGPAGGLIFHIDGSTYYEAAPGGWDGGNDPILQWGCGWQSISGAGGTAIGTGASNTQAIVDFHDDTSNFNGNDYYTFGGDYGTIGCTSNNNGEVAAKYVDNAEINGVSDWFLPSLNEMSEMYQNLHLESLGGFTSNWYHSSSESSFNNMWMWSFSSGAQTDFFNKPDAYRVRPARSFTVADAQLASVGNTVIFDLVNVTNQDVEGSFYARIYTYEDPEHALGYTLADPWAGGDVIDAGGVALSTVETIDITFMVQERITFCVFTNELSAPGDYQTCSGTSAGPVIMGDDNGFLSVNEPSISKDTKYNIATNASAGATIRVRGNTLASGSAMIDPIGSTPAGSVTGTEQFGLCTYLHPNSLSGGLIPSSPYNHVDCVNTVAGQGGGNDAGAQFAFDDTGITSVYGQAIATKTAGDWSTGKLVLLANVSNVTQPGIYTTEFYIVATGRY